MPHDEPGDTNDLSIKAAKADWRERKNHDRMMHSQARMGGHILLRKRGFDSGQYRDTSEQPERIKNADENMATQARRERHKRDDNA